MLALGDSYTIGQGVEVHERWPEQLMDSLEAKGFTTSDPDIIATTGWTTSDLIGAVDAAAPDSNYSLVSLLIGVNNQFRNESIETYKIEFEELLNRAVAYAGGITHHVLVVSIPDYAFTPVGMQFSNVSEEIEAFNAVNDSIAALYGVPYLYITDISQRGLDEPELVALDRLHPSGKMYAEWVERLLSEAELDLSTSVRPELQPLQVLIYPNPAAESLYRTTADEVIYLTDIHGRLIEVWPAGEGRMSVAHLPTGIYILKSRFWSRKVILR